MKSSFDKIAVLTGLGRLGLRHLQGLVGSKLFSEIVVLDEFIERATKENSVDAALTGRDRAFTEIIIDPPQKYFQTRPVTLFVDATLSLNRLERYQQICAYYDLNPMATLLEKMVFSNKQEAQCEDTRMLSGQRVLVNCSRNTWPAYRKIRDYVSDHFIDEIQITMTGVDLASNLIHFVALIDYLAPQDAEVNVIDADLKWSKSLKRQGFGECFGGISYEYGRLIVNISAERGAATESTLLVIGRDGGKAKWSFDEISGLLDIGGCEYETRAPFQSENHLMYQQLLRNKSELPTIVDSIKHHRTVFELFGGSNLKVILT